MNQRMAIYMQDVVDIRAELELARYMEARGFSEIWQGDNRLARDCIVLMSAFLTHTSRLRVRFRRPANLDSQSCGDRCQFLLTVGAWRKGKRKRQGDVGPRSLVGADCQPGWSYHEETSHSNERTRRGDPRAPGDENRHVSWRIRTPGKCFP